VAFPVPVLLVALNVTVTFPADVGVPEIKPVPLFTVIPAGQSRCCVAGGRIGGGDLIREGASTEPPAVVALVMTGAGTAMVRVRVAWPVPPLLVALSVTVEVPAAVGVPEIKPVPLFTVIPAGKAVAA